MEKGGFGKINSLIAGEILGARWNSPQFEIIREDEGKELEVSDAPWLGSNVLIFRPKAIRALGSPLAENGELLPLRCPGHELFAYNVTRRLDALDESPSSIQRFSSGKIM